MRKNKFTVGLASFFAFLRLEFVLSNGGCNGPTKYLGNNQSQKKKRLLCFVYGSTASMLQKMLRFTLIADNQNNNEKRFVSP